MIAFAETLTEGQGWTLIGLVTLLTIEQARHNRLLAKGVSHFGAKVGVQNERLAAVRETIADGHERIINKLDKLPNETADAIERRKRA